MDFLNQTTTPTYYIYRDGAADDPFDPTAPLQFFPPKDSDELWMALRSAYPNVATHSERMRNAVIEFLVNEGQAQQAATSTQTSPVMTLDNSMIYESASTSSYSPYISMESSSSSSNGSPHLSAPSPAISQAVQRTNSQASAAPARSGANLDQMTSVFSLTSHSQPKLRTRRKMTEAEKVEYRKRRSAGACQSCSSRKRKCKHTKDASASVTTTTTTGTQPRVVKPLSKKQGKQIASPTAPVTSTGPPLSSKTLISFDDPIPGDLMSFDDAELFPWQADADWTLLDFDAPVLPDFSITNHNQSRAFDDRTSPDNHGLAQGLGNGLDHGLSHGLSQGLSAHGPQIKRTDPHLFNGPLVNGPVVSAQQPTHTFHTHNAQAPCQQSETVASGLAMSSVYSEERLRHKSAGSSDTGRGPVDGAHDYSPTFAKNPQDLADHAGAATIENARGLTTDSNANKQVSPVAGQSSSMATSGARASALRQRPTTTSNVRAHSAGVVAGLPVEDVIAAASVKERQSLTLRDSGQVSPSMSFATEKLAGLATSSASRPVPQALSVGIAANTGKVRANEASSPVLQMTTRLTSADNFRGLDVQDGADVVHTRLDRPATSGYSSSAILGDLNQRLFTATQTATQKLENGSFANDDHDVRLTLETFLKSIGEIQKCIICAMISSLPAVRITTGPTSSSSLVTAMDELTSLCSSMQLAAA